LKNVAAINHDESAARIDMGTNKQKSMSTHALVDKMSIHGKA
jgi:hypothetical protein